MCMCKLIRWCLELVTGLAWDWARQTQAASLSYGEDQLPAKTVTLISMGSSLSFLDTGAVVPSAIFQLRFIDQFQSRYLTFR